MGIGKIAGLADIFNWGKRLSKSTVPTVETSSADAKRINDVKESISQKKPDSDYMTKVGSTPPFRFIIGPSGDIKKIR